MVQDIAILEVEVALLRGWAKPGWGLSRLPHLFLK